MREHVRASLLGMVIGDALGSPYAGYSSLPSLLGSHAQSSEVNERLRKHAEPSVLSGALMLMMESVVAKGGSDWHQHFFDHMIALATQCHGHLVTGTNLGFAGRIRRLVDRWRSDSFVEHGQSTMDDISVFGDALPLALFFGCLVRDETAHVASDIVDFADILCVDAESVVAMAYATGIIRATLMDVPWGHPDATELGREVALSTIKNMRASERLPRTSASMLRAEGTLALAHAKLNATSLWSTLQLPEEIDARDAPQQLLLNALAYSSCSAEKALSAIGNLPRKGADVDIVLPLVAGLLGCRHGMSFFEPLQALIAPVDDYQDRVAVFLQAKAPALNFVSYRKAMFRQK